MGVLPDRCDLNYCQGPVAYIRSTCCGHSIHYYTTLLEKISKSVRSGIDDKLEKVFMLSKIGRRLRSIEMTS